jgi:hypothetical protein
MEKKSELPVFRLVDGQLVRIPGDIQDPKRRYAGTANATTGEQYLREFTDAEERQRDAEEAEWEAQRPQREAEQKQREEEARNFRESLKYEERIVAFLDVLGWGHAIAQSAHSPDLVQKLGIAMQGIGAHVKMNAWQREHGWDGDPMITHFSDSVLISVAVHRFAKDQLEWMLRGVVQGLLFAGFFVRGAVAYGPLIHREALVYGPALIEAYRLESTEAKAPRIILDESIARAWGDGVPIQDRSGTLLGHHRTWRQDDDGRFFFDYMPDPLNIFRFGPRQIDAGLASHMKRCRELISQGLLEHANNARVLSKYEWLAKYYEKVRKENEEQGWEPIG